MEEGGRKSTNSYLGKKKTKHTFSIYFLLGLFIELWGLTSSMNILKFYVVDLTACKSMEQRPSQ